MESSIKSHILRGAGAGIVATGAMSIAMAFAQKLGWLGTMPPKVLLRSTLEKADVDDAVSERTLDLLAVSAHFAFGAATGALFALLNRVWARPNSAATRGVLFATGVWLLSYWGWIPALGLMPPPPRDRPGRPTGMLVSHLIFGATLGAVTVGK